MRTIISILKEERYTLAATVRTAQRVIMASLIIVSAVFLGRYFRMVCLPFLLKSDGGKNDKDTEFYVGAHMGYADGYINSFYRALVYP